MMGGAVAAVVASYLLGCFPSAYMVARLGRGVDIRQHGSGNMGATNTLRVAGKAAAIIVLLADMLKGILAVTVVAAAASRLSDIELPVLKAVCGGAAVCGHMFNVFLSGRGGKGVATSAGVLLMVSPPALGVGFLALAVTVAVTGYVSLGSLLASIIVPFTMLAIGAPSSYVALSAFLSVLIVAKHKENIKRLLSGRENKFVRRR